MKKLQTKEEKVAIRFGELVNDVTLDLDQIGKYIARQLPTISHRRLGVIIESAEEEKNGNTIQE